MQFYVFDDCGYCLMFQDAEVLQGYMFLQGINLTL